MTKDSVYYKCKIQLLESFWYSVSINNCKVSAIAHQYVKDSLMKNLYAISERKYQKIYVHIDIKDSHGLMLKFIGPCLIFKLYCRIMIEFALYLYLGYDRHLELPDLAVHSIDLS